jgi:hypothetical protein
VCFCYPDPGGDAGALFPCATLPTGHWSRRCKFLAWAAQGWRHWLIDQTSCLLPPGTANSQMASLGACHREYYFWQSLYSTLSNALTRFDDARARGEHIPLHHRSTVCLSEASLHGRPRAFFKTEFVSYHRAVLAVWLHLHKARRRRSSSLLINFIKRGLLILYGQTALWLREARNLECPSNVFWGCIWGRRCGPLQPDTCARRTQPTGA